MAAHDFESFIRRQLSELRDRLVAEYRRVDRSCAPSSSWTQPIGVIEGNWSPGSCDLEDADEVPAVASVAVNGTSKTFVPVPPAPDPEPAHSPSTSGLPELFDREGPGDYIMDVNYSSMEVNCSEGEDKRMSENVTQSPIHPVCDAHEKANGQQDHHDRRPSCQSNHSSESEDFVNHDENLTKRLSKLDPRLSLLDDKTGSKFKAPNIQVTGAAGKLSAPDASRYNGGKMSRSVRMSAMVSMESIEAKPEDGKTRLWGLEELEDCDVRDDTSDESPKRKGFKESKSQRRSAAFAESHSHNSQARSRGQSFARGYKESDFNPFAGTPRGSGVDHTFSVLPVWTTQGVAAMRKRAFSMRTKSLFLEVDLEKTKEDCTAPQDAGAWWMLHPSSTKHLIWDMLGLALLAYDCIVIPLEVYEMAESGFVLFMNWIIRMYWTCSIFKSFLTGYLKDDGAVEMRFSFVSRRYSLTWLPMDLLVVLVDWAEVVVAGFASGGFQRFGSGLRGLRMVRTVRLIRLIKAPEIANFINEQIRSEQILLVATIAKVIIIMLGVAHVLACAWFGIGRWSSSGQLSWLRESGVDRLDKGQQYVSSFHWSLSQFAGELTQAPVNSAERIFTVCVLFFAIMVSAWFVSSITTSMTQLQIITSQQSTQTAVLRRYLVDQNISRPLALRVQRNAQHALQEQKKNASESSVELLKYISNPLLVELHFEIHGHVLFHHPFFQKYNEINPGGIRKVCHMAVSVLSLHPGDVLFRDLEVPTHRRMFFVMHGGMVYKHGGNSTAYVEKGDWMTEAILWTTWTHCGTVKAYTETQLLVLEAEKFQDTISTFPSDHPAQYAEEFIKRLNQAGRFLTDIALDPFEIEDMINEAFPNEDSDDSDLSSEMDEDGQEDEVVMQTRESEDTRASTPKLMGKRASVTSTRSRHSRSSKRNSRLSSNFAKRSSQLVAKGFNTLLGTTAENIPSRSSKMSNKPVDLQQDRDKANKISKRIAGSKTRSGSSKKASFFTFMGQPSKQSIFSLSSKGKAATHRGSMDISSGEPSTGTRSGSSTEGGSGPASAWMALWKKKDVNDAPPAPQPMQLEINGVNSEDMQVVPMGGLGFNEQPHDATD